MQACAVGAIKISVESVAESMILKYNINNSKIRLIGEDTAEHEMMIDYNGPAIGEADGVLMVALQLHFKDNPKGIHFDTHNIFRSNGLIVQNVQKVDYISLINKLD